METGYTTKSIAEMTHRLDCLKYKLDTLLYDNGGDFNEEAQAMEAEIQEIENSLLSSKKGVDSYGRYLSRVMSDIEMYKAEEKKLATQRKHLEGIIERAKIVAGQALRAKGEDSVKGDFYGFKVSNSITTKCDNSALMASYEKPIAEIRSQYDIPDWVTIELKGSVKLAKELGELEGNPLFSTEITETATFSRPRKVNESKEGKE